MDKKLRSRGYFFPLLFHFLNSLFVLLLTCLYLFVARAVLDTIFKKREARAAKGSAVETHRDKRVRIGDGPSVTVKEAVPTFLSQRPLSLDEDTSPFTVTWGLQRRDTVVGSSKAATVWSESVITPRDRAEIVESSDDLQIERLGAQAVASMNTYLQAALHNLKDVRTSLTIDERDRDRYLKAFEANFTRFCEVEKELADEKEKVRKLELDAERARADVIAEYKASQDFQDVLNAEYDANFPETFSSCWEQIVEEI
ncbi:uncharacterized protein LOC141690546 [Apium graveolens]|uniref:uncharacterized protein LOC141690546 n=1 Tax=Apium graveolens TaxID=4045 RepID=UPI003D7AE9C8